MTYGLKTIVLQYGSLHIRNKFTQPASRVKFKNVYVQNSINILAGFNFYQSCTGTELQGSNSIASTQNYPLHFRFFWDVFSTLKTDSFDTCPHIFIEYVYMSTAWIFKGIFYWFPIVEMRIYSSTHHCSPLTYFLSIQMSNGVIS